MTTFRNTTGGPASRVPATRTWARPPGLALLCLAAIGLAQAGCRSNGCGGCGFGSRLTSGLQSVGDRIGNHFQKKGGNCATCGEGGGVGGYEEGGIVDSGIPITTPGMAMPGSGTIVPAPTNEPAPMELEPIPSNGPAKPTAAGTGTGPGTGSTNPASSSRVGPGNNRSAYEATLPKAGIASRRRGGDLARAYHSPPEAAPRPPLASGAGAESSDVLSNLPPVDPPAEFPRKPGSAAAVAPSSAPTAPASTPGPAAMNRAAPTAAEVSSAAEGGTIPPLAVVAASLRQTPGIRRSAFVAPGLGGGSVPSVEGLDWLKEKGYRTFIDLRQGAEVEPTFAEAVNDRGMVYISLPILATRLDPNRLARFDDLISRPESRPLYFCDTDGSRAGLVWYLHLRGVEGDDARSAAQKAEEIGLIGAQVRAAEAYLDARKPKATPPVATPAPAPPPAAKPAPNPASPPPKAGAAPSPAPAAGSPPASEVIAPDFGPAPLDTPPMPTLPGDERPQTAHLPARGDYAELSTWRPAAALVLTGVGVPLAFWGRSAFTVARSVRRASLPASARGSLGLPAGSDA